MSLLFGISACGSSAANTPLTVLSITGDNVLVQKAGSNTWITGKAGMSLEAGEKIKTDTGATASVTFFDGSVIELNNSTEISLDELLAKSSTSPKTIKIGQKIGETSSTIVKLVDPASRYEVDTQAGVAAVGGSKMVVTVAGDGTTEVYNVEGSISFTAQGQQVNIPAGSVSSAKPGEIPGAPQPGTPPAFGAPAVTSISATTGWQQTTLYLNAGDKFYVDYRGGSWTVDYKNFPYVGPGGYSADIDKTIAAGYKFDSSVPYGYLLGKVGTGDVIFVGVKGGPFTADVSGFLSLRINDTDSTLRDNDGAITVGLQATDYSALDNFSTTNENPNGSWSYGWMPTDFSKFNAYTAYGTFMWYGALGSDLTPYIWINTGDLTNGVPPGITSTNGIASGVPTGWLSLHPGPGSEASVLRWTAPVMGDIHVTGQFLAGDRGIMTVAVRHNNQQIWSAKDAGKFDLTIKIAAGDTIDFTVYGGYGYGNTPVSANISY
jgi:hypothetical protein